MSTPENLASWVGIHLGEHNHMTAHDICPCNTKLFSLHVYYDIAATVKWQPSYISYTPDPNHELICSRRVFSLSFSYISVHGFISSFI
jgi:hypothetical protein